MNKEARMVIYSSPPDDRAAHAKHQAVLKGLKYDFTNSLFQY